MDYMPGKPPEEVPTKVHSTLRLPGFHIQDADTQVIIVTPWVPGTTTVKFPNQVNQIKQHIKQLLPNAVEAKVEGYFNIGHSDPFVYKVSDLSIMANSSSKKCF